jgi:mannose-6-phosphate isomerase-like protein (cupin superfamily)
MASTINLTAELEKLKMMHGRTPQSTRAEREGTAASLAPYHDGHLFISKFAGKGAWERHPVGDELVHIIEGSGILHIVTDDNTQRIEVSAGMVAVIPQGAWHRFLSSEGVTLMTATPSPSEHVRIDRRRHVLLQAVHQDPSSVWMRMWVVVGHTDVRRASRVVNIMPLHSSRRALRRRSRNERLPSSARRPGMA